MEILNQAEKRYKNNKGKGALLHQPTKQHISTLLSVSSYALDNTIYGLIIYLYYLFLYRFIYYHIYIRYSYHTTTTNNILI